MNKLDFLSLEAPVSIATVDSIGDFQVYTPGIGIVKEFSVPSLLDTYLDAALGLYNNMSNVPNMFMDEFPEYEPDGDCSKCGRPHVLRIYDTFDGSIDSSDGFMVQTALLCDLSIAPRFFIYNKFTKDIEYEFRAISFDMNVEEKCALHLPKLKTIKLPD